MKFRDSAQRDRVCSILLSLGGVSRDSVFEKEDGSLRMTFRRDQIINPVQLAAFDLAVSIRNEEALSNLTVLELIHLPSLLFRAAVAELIVPLSLGGGAIDLWIEKHQPAPPIIQYDKRCGATYLEKQRFHDEIRSNVEAFDLHAKHIGPQDDGAGDYMSLGICRGCGTTVTRAEKLAEVVK